MRNKGSAIRSAAEGEILINFLFKQVSTRDKKISPRQEAYLTSAITSISTFASFGKRATSTQERAGL
jgi:hypothetical protein